LDKLKFNDNSNNEYSDSFYVATLLSGLARTLVTQKDGAMMSFEFDTMEQEITSVDLQRDAVNEIERHRRIDEWIPSYGHILTTTALDCLLRLSEGKDASPRIEEFLQYTQPENTDTVRLKAFNCLIALGSMRDPMICYWILHSFHTDPSPYFRDKLWQIIEHGLGKVALGGSNISVQPVTNGLIVEGDAIESRQQAMERTKTLTGAMKSLKMQLGQSSILQGAIMEALKSPLISMYDFFELLTICRILYDPIDRLVLNLRLPRYWQVEHLGNGLVHFKNTGHYRTKPKPKLELGRKRSRPVSSDVSRSESPETKRPRTSESPNVKRGRRVSAQSNSPLPLRRSPLKDTDVPTSSPGLPLNPAQPSRSSTSSEKPVPPDRPGMIKLKGLDKTFLARLDGPSTSPTLVGEVQPPQPIELPPPTGTSIGVESQIPSIAAGTAPAGSPPPSTDGKPIKLRIRFS
jgi:transcription initiation factor TFIID subunit 2